MYCCVPTHIGKFIQKKNAKTITMNKLEKLRDIGRESY